MILKYMIIILKRGIIVSTCLFYFHCPPTMEIGTDLDLSKERYFYFKESSEIKIGKFSILVQEKYGKEVWRMNTELPESITYKNIGKIYYGRKIGKLYYNDYIEPMSLEKGKKYTIRMGGSIIGFMDFRH